MYDAVCSHIQAEDTKPLQMVVSRTAGTGKSFPIYCLKALLLDHLHVMAPTGVAAFNVGGFTLHSVLHLPTCGEFSHWRVSSFSNFSKVLVEWTTSSLMRCPC